MNLANLGVIRRNKPAIVVPTFQPTDLANIQLWLDASQESYTNGSTPTIATDFSGLNRDFSVEASTYTTGGQNNKAFFSLGGSGKVSNSNTANWAFTHNGQFTIFIVARAGTLVSGETKQLFSSFSGSSSSIGNRLFLDHRPAINSALNKIIRVVTGRGAFPYIVDKSSAVNYIQPYENVTSVYQMYADYTTSAANSIAFKINQDVEVTTERNNFPSSSVSGESFFIGSAQTLSSTSKGVDEVYEAIIYNRVLTASERTQVINYLNTKYAL